VRPADSRVADADVVAAACAGDRGAFRLLIARHGDALYRFLRARVGNEAEAEDLVQEVFVAAYRALHRYDPTRPLRTWLLAIAVNKSRDWRRRRAVRSFFTRATPLASEALQVASDEVPTDRQAADRQALAHAWAALSTIPATLAEPLLLTAVEGLSQAEAGAVLGISAKAVETRIYRARAALRTALEGHGGGLRSNESDA